MTSSTPHPEESPRFVWTTLAIYVAFVSIVSAFHEPWKDETQTWRLAIDSHGIRALAHNARYEGHPLLFHVMVQALGHLSRSWWAVSRSIVSQAVWLANFMLACVLEPLSPLPQSCLLLRISTGEMKRRPSTSTALKPPSGVDVRALRSHAARCLPPQTPGAGRSICRPVSGLLDRASKLHRRHRILGNELTAELHPTLPRYFPPGC